MSKLIFKPGDIVRCINSLHMSGVKKGQIYKISEINIIGGEEVIGLEGVYTGKPIYLNWRFEPLEVPPMEAFL